MAGSCGGRPRTLFDNGGPTRSRGIAASPSSKRASRTSLGHFGEWLTLLPIAADVAVAASAGGRYSGRRRCSISTSERMPYAVPPTAAAIQRPCVSDGINNECSIGPRRTSAVTNHGDRRYRMSRRPKRHLATGLVCRGRLEHNRANAQSDGGPRDATPPVIARRRHSISVALGADGSVGRHRQRCDWKTMRLSLFVTDSRVPPTTSRSLPVSILRSSSSLLRLSISRSLGYRSRESRCARARIACYFKNRLP